MNNESNKTKSPLKSLAAKFSLWVISLPEFQEDEEERLQWIYRPLLKINDLLSDRGEYLGNLPDLQGEIKDPKGTIKELAAWVEKTWEALEIKPEQEINDSTTSTMEKVLNLISQMKAVADPPDHLD